MNRLVLTVPVIALVAACGASGSSATPGPAATVTRQAAATTAPAVCIRALTAADSEFSAFGLELDNLALALKDAGKGEFAAAERIIHSQHSPSTSRYKSLEFECTSG